MNRNVRSVVESHCAVGESPIWHPEERCVYWVDITKFRIHRWSSADPEIQTWQFDIPVTALSLTTGAEILVALGGRLIFWNPSTDTRREFVTVDPRWPANRLNDGATGPDGNFWVGSMQNNVAADGSELPVTHDSGSLYSVTPEGRVTEQDTGFGITNTIEWNPTRTRFYTACSIKATIYEYEFEQEHSRVSNRRVLVNSAYPGVPDGSAVDMRGTIWNCRHGGKRILGFSPEGKLVDEIEMPVTHVTKCIYGGEDRRTLYITTASLGAPAGEDSAGNLFAVEMETPGLPPNRFGIASEKARNR